LADPNVSHGTFTLAPGSHSLTIEAIVSVTGQGAAYFRIDPFTFAGIPGNANCHGKSVSALAQQFGGLNSAAAAFGFPSVAALQDAIEGYCGG
jgi:hypothetical protein